MCIYRATIVVVLLIETEVQGFSRFHKVATGAGLRENALQCVRRVTLAQRRRGRAAATLSVRIRLTPVAPQGVHR